MKRKLSLVIASLGATTIALFGSVTAANAEIVDNGAELLIESALDANDANITDPALLEELVQEVIAAEELELLDPTIVDEANLQAEDPTLSDEPLEELVDDQTDEQLENWQEEAPAIKAAFDAVRADFEQCRAESDGSAATCAKELRFQFQFALAEVKLARIDEEVAKVAMLPENEQAARLAALETQRTRVLALLSKAETAAADSGLTLTATETQRLNGLITELNSRAAVIQGATVAAGAAETGAGGANAGGNASGNAGSGSENSAASGGNSSSGNSSGNASAGSGNASAGSGNSAASGDSSNSGGASANSNAGGPNASSKAKR